MAGGDLLVSSWDGHAELKAPCFKTRKVPAGPERLLWSGSLPHLPQQPMQAQQAPLRQRGQRVQGNLGILHGGHLGASDHVALLLLALKTKWKLIPCSSWAVEAPRGCSPLQLNPLPAAEACRKQGWCWSCTGRAAVLALSLRSLPCVCLLQGA